MLKKYVVCEEIINNKPSGCFSVRVNTDCSPTRFKMVDSFDSYEQANHFIEILRIIIGTLSK